MLIIVGELMRCILLRIIVIYIVRLLNKFTWLIMYILETVVSTSIFLFGSGWPGGKLINTHNPAHIFFYFFKIIFSDQIYCSVKFKYNLYTTFLASNTGILFCRWRRPPCECMWWIFLCGLQHDQQQVVLLLLYPPHWSLQHLVAVKLNTFINSFLR